MKKLSAVVIILFWLTVPTLAISGSSPSPGGWTGNVNAFLGFKYLDEDEWEPADEQNEYGIELDFKQQGWPISIAIDYLSGSGDGTYGGIKFESETSELNLGVRKIWDASPTIRPFIGGGIAFITGEFSGLGLSEEDNAVGFWLGGGIYWTLAKHFNIGFEGKFSSAEVTLFGVDADAGGTHIGLLAGFHW